MPFYPHELLSVLRVIHIFNLVASSQNRKCHGDGVVRITLSSTDRDHRYHIRIHTVFIVRFDDFRCDHLIKPHDAKS